MAEVFKIIDLFAGPGGLGEGFSSFSHDGKLPFKIAISIEKEESAHRTLLLRSLFRQFSDTDVPEAYYAFLRGELGRKPEDQLYQMKEMADGVLQARQEAQRLTLGQDDPRVIYARIREKIGSGECILIGGPPCQAYSVVGRSRNFGEKTKKYKPHEDHRNFLYLEYLKVISKFQPAVFVMENVKGMLSAKIDGHSIFESILSDLVDPFRATGVRPDKGRTKHKYRLLSLCEGESDTTLFSEIDESVTPKDFVVRMENYGIPQARHRVIIIGVRDDFCIQNGEEHLLERSVNKLSVGEVIGDLPKIRSRLSKGNDTVQNWRSSICDFEAILSTKLKNNALVPPKVVDKLQSTIRGFGEGPETVGADQGLRMQSQGGMPKLASKWFKDTRMGNFVCNHESRGHITSDLHRYLYYSAFANSTGVSPNAHNLPKPLWPAHRNFGSGKFADRFRVQIHGLPATTVTSHISKDGHYFIHFDPLQCRSLTVREAARLQTFPDNYFFVGNRTQQYVQAGNAVPPLFAAKIAEKVFAILSS